MNGGYIMNSNKFSSREEMKTLIQEEMIGSIKSAVDDSSIIFEKPENRLPDDKLDQMYPIIYNIWCEYKYEKRTKKTRLNIVVGKNFEAVSAELSPFYRQVHLKLEQSVINHLISWGHQAASELNTYLKDDGYALKKVRFDLLPQADNTFVIPNLPLENVYFYNPRKGPNTLVPTYEYINMRLEMESPEAKKEDEKALASFYEAMKKAQENK